MIKIKYILFIIITFMFIGCGGGSGDATYDDGSVVIDNNGDVVSEGDSSSSSSSVGGDSSSSSSNVGGGGSSSGTTNNAILVTISNCNTYTPLQTNDSIIKDSDPTTLQINTYADDSKEVCIVNGNAHILRGN